MEQQEQLLKLNPETGYYEGIFTVRVEPEIFRRVLFTYIEDYHIDPTDLAAWGKAIHEVARVGKWFAHPRAQVAPVEVCREIAVEPSPVNTVVAEEQKVQKKITKTVKYPKSLSREEEKTLWDKAMELPVTEWDTLLTPIPDVEKRDKWPYYYRRHAEHESLKKLKEQLTPAPLERMEVIAEAVNGNKIR